MNSHTLFSGKNKKNINSSSANSALEVQFVCTIKTTFDMTRLNMRYLYLTLSSLDKIFSRQHIEIFFLIFQTGHFMQIHSLGDSLLEVLNHIFKEK